MALEDISRAVGATYRDILRHHAFQAAAALSYYFVLAAFPALIFLSAFMAVFPLPNLFGHVLDLMTRLLPASTMRVLAAILAAATSSNRSEWISASVVAVLWVTSAAFDALIEALDIAYDVDDPRPFWKTRLLAMGLSLFTGILLTTALCVMILGPRFATWLAARVDLSQVFVAMWPVLHWTIAVTFSVVAVEAIYFLAPNVKQRFSATLPGAVLAVAFWLALSYLLGIYFRHFANYDYLYGTLSGFIALMTWLYWSSFVLLVGAELNAELAKQTARGALPARKAGKTEKGAPAVQTRDRAA